MNLPALAARCAQLKPTRLHVALPLLIMVVLYWLSSIPGTPLPDDPAVFALFYWISPSVQNVLHVPAYAALACAWRWALGAWIRSKLTMSMIAGGVSVIYGVFDEWHQSFIPGRYASLTDVALDVVGAALGIWLAARVFQPTSDSAVSATDRDH